MVPPMPIFASDIRLDSLSSTYLIFELKKFLICGKKAEKKAEMEAEWKRNWNQKSRQIGHSQFFCKFGPLRFAFSYSNNAVISTTPFEQ